MRTKLIITTFIANWLSTGSMQAQLSSNPDKFLGNITTSGQIDFGTEKFYQLWNQITPENETKWESVQRNSQNSWNWGSVDNINNYAKNDLLPPPIRKKYSKDHLILRRVAAGHLPPARAATAFAKARCRGNHPRCPERL